MDFDEAQESALASILRGESVSIVGGAGSGKTRVIHGAVLELLRRNPDQRIAVLSPDRRAASDLRNAISRQAEVLGEGVTIQSTTAFAYSIVSTFAQAIGRRAPELITGPEQDAMIRDLFEVAALGGDQELAYALEGMQDLASIAAYRNEYRDLITRAAELGMTSEQLRQLGEAEGIAAWVTGALLMKSYEGALAAGASSTHAGADRTDHARLTSFAARALERWDDSLDERSGSGVIGIEKPRWDYVFVDDVVNSPLSIVSLLKALRGDGSVIVTAGNPDQAVQGYRGGVAHLPMLLTRPEPHGGIAACLSVLDGRYRGGGAVAAAIDSLTCAIHVAGTGEHRRQQSGSESTALEGLAFLNTDDQYRHIATQMRRRHAVDGVAYSDMVVVARTSGRFQAVRRALTGLGVPVKPLQSAQPLREQRAVRGLLSLIDIAESDSSAADVSVIREVLEGPYSGINPRHARTAIRQLRGWDIAGGGHRSDDDLFRSILDLDEQSPAHQVGEFSGLRDILGKIRDALRNNSIAERVLWIAWDATGVAEQWRTAALGEGDAAESAHENLDAVLQLFRVAQRLADRDPANARICDLRDLLDRQDVAEDSIARVASGAQGVELVTPSATLGRSWADVYIIDLNEGTWPNTKLRNPLTRVPDLVSTMVSAALGGEGKLLRQLPSDVIDDELRMLVQAMSRAEQRVTVSCVQAEDTSPSRFAQRIFITPDEVEELALLAEHQDQAAASDDYVATVIEADPYQRGHVMRKVTVASEDYDALGIIAQARRASSSDDADVRQAASEILAEFERFGYGEATTDLWFEAMAVTRANEDAFTFVSISPSSARDTFKCSLRGFLGRIGASQTTPTLSLDRGNLVHTIAEEFPSLAAAGEGANEDRLREAMRARFEELWSELGMSDGYFDTRKKVETRAMVDLLAKYIASVSADVIVETSASFNDPAKGYRVDARIDRIELDPADRSHGRIVDFKTGKRMSRDEVANDPQLSIYQWLARRGAIQAGKGRPAVTNSSGAKLVYVSPSQAKEPTFTEYEQSAMTEQRFEETTHLLDSVATLLRGPQFATNPDYKLCQQCEFTTLCPAQKGGRIFS